VSEILECGGDDVKVILASVVLVYEIYNITDGRDIMAPTIRMDELFCTHYRNG
jgi:hypothetical protein